MSPELLQVRPGHKQRTFWTVATSFLQAGRPGWYQTYNIKIKYNKTHK